jgi:hypothetical protein
VRFERWEAKEKDRITSVSEIIIYEMVFTAV